MFIIFYPGTYQFPHEYFVQWSYLFISFETNLVCIDQLLVNVYVNMTQSEWPPQNPFTDYQVILSTTKKFSFARSCLKLLSILLSNICLNFSVGKNLVFTVYIKTLCNLDPISFKRFLILFTLWILYFSFSFPKGRVVLIERGIPASEIPFVNFF